MVYPSSSSPCLPFEMLCSMNCVLVGNLQVSELKFVSDKLITDLYYSFMSSCSMCSFPQDEDNGMKSKIHHIAKEIMSSEKV